ncbi:hypothetical protein B0H21DRAFT_832319 [Amylocystis lapponica]|nr:hypothetical protein B0H21DRAFT_832319 [Amylocystis lapponica]
METLCPFQLLYTDGVERLGAESARKRVRWVSAIWEALDQAILIPDRSVTRSPTGSICTIRSVTGTSTSQSSSASSSASTVYYVPLLDTIPDLSDLQSLSGSSTRLGVSRRPSLASAYHMCAADDGAVSNQAYIYHGDPRLIAPSRSSSLWRTSSLTDLDQGFESALQRARDGRPGPGFGLGLAEGISVGDGSPVTVSSGPRLGHDVYMSPPPRVGRGSGKARSCASESATSISDKAFWTARSGTEGTRTQTSVFYSSSSFTRGLTSTNDRTGTGLVTDETVVDVVLGSGTNIVTSTLLYRGTTTNSMLGDLHSGSGLSTSTSPSRSGLSRAKGLRRRTPSSNSCSYSSTYPSGTEESSDKENTGTYSTTYGTRSGLESFSYTNTGTYTPNLSTLRGRDSKSEYVTAKSPSMASVTSLPTISFLSDYETVDVCSTEYETAPQFLTEPTSEYKTVDICPMEPGSEYVTAEVCATEVSTDYNTAECRYAKREEPEGDEISSMSDDLLDVEPEEEPQPEVELELPLEDEEDEEGEPRESPENIPLPPSDYKHEQIARTPSDVSSLGRAYAEAGHTNVDTPYSSNRSLESTSHYKNRRDQEVPRCRDELWRELEEWLAALPPLDGPSPIPVPPSAADIGVEVPAEESPAAAETQSVIESICGPECRNAQEILDTAERERLQAEAVAAYEVRFSEEQARVRALEEELAAVRAELENE